MEDPNKHEEGGGDWWLEIIREAKASNSKKRKVGVLDTDEYFDDLGDNDEDLLSSDNENVDEHVSSSDMEEDEFDPSDHQPPAQEIKAGSKVKLVKPIKVGAQGFAVGSILEVLDVGSEKIRVRLGDKKSRALFDQEFNVAEDDIKLHETGQKSTKVSAVLTDKRARLADRFASTINRDVQERPLLFGSLGRNSGHQKSREVAAALDRATGGDGNVAKDGHGGDPYVGENTYAAVSVAWQDDDGNSYDRRMLGKDQEKDGKVVPGPSYSMEDLEAQAKSKKTPKELRDFQESEYVHRQTKSKPPPAVASGQIKPAVEAKGRHWHAEDHALYSETFLEEAQRSFDQIRHLMEKCRVPEFKKPKDIPRPKKGKEKADLEEVEEDDLEDIDDDEIAQYIITDPEELEQRKREIEEMVGAMDEHEAWDYDVEDAVQDLAALNIGGIRRQFTLIVSKYTCQSGADKKGVSGGCQREVAELVRRFWDSVATEFGKEKAFLMEMLAGQGGPLEFEISVAGSYADGPARENGLIESGGKLRMHMAVQFAAGGEAKVGWIGSSAKYVQQIQGAHDEMGLDYPDAPPAGNPSVAQQEDEAQRYFIGKISQVGHAGAIEYTRQYLENRGIALDITQAAKLLQGVRGDQADWPKQVFLRVKALLQRRGM